MSHQVTVHLRSGRSYKIGRNAISKTRRLLGDRIARIDYNNGEQPPSLEAKTFEPDTSKDDGAESPSDKWTKGMLQERCDELSINYKPSDTKKILLKYIQAAEK